MTIEAPAPNEQSLSRVVGIVRQLCEGRSNAVGSVTLAANASTTTVTTQVCGTGSVVLLSPRTANAAAAIATTYVSSVSAGAFTLTHANNAQTDRTFGYAVQG